MKSSNPKRNVPHVADTAALGRSRSDFAGGTSRRAARLALAHGGNAPVGVVAPKPPPVLVLYQDLADELGPAPVYGQYPVHPIKRCDKCFHPLPYRRRTWEPFWSWFEEAGGPRLTYAGDGPPLGYVMEFTDPYGTHYYRAYALVARPERGKAWPSMEEVTLGRRTQRNGMRNVEAVVRERGLWLRSKTP